MCLYTCGYEGKLLTLPFVSTYEPSTCVYVNMYVFIYMCTCGMCLYTCVHAVCVYINVCMRYVFIYMCTFGMCLYKCVHVVCVYIHVYMWSLCASCDSSAYWIRLSMYVYMCICMYLHADILALCSSCTSSAHMSPPLW